MGGLTALDAIPDLMRQSAVPGLILGVWEDGAAPYLRGFGVRDTATGEPMTPDLYMRIGSLSKTFTTTAVLQLVDRGDLGLDDSIASHLADVPCGDAITIRQLAGMRSGLWDYSEEVIPLMPGQPGRQWTPEELLAIGYRNSPLFAPDAKFDYSNTNTVLLGVLVETVTGQSLKDFVHQHILAPQQLAATFVPSDATLPKPHAHGYTRTPDGTVDAATWNPSWGFGAGNMISAASDLARWARALATGALLSAATQGERMKFLPAPPEGDGTLYGLGLENQNGWIGHNGNIAGYQSYMYFLPSENKSIVMLANSNVDPVGVWKMFGHIVDDVSPNHGWPGLPKTT